MEAAAQEVRQHRLDLDQVAELRMRDCQAHRDRLIQGRGQVNRAQLLHSLGLEEPVAVMVEDATAGDDGCERG